MLSLQTSLMSRKGNCLDNYVMENFFGKMKNEMFYGHEYEFNTLDEYRHYYNEERIQIKLKGLTPCQARNQALSCLSIKVSKKLGALQSIRSFTRFCIGSLTNPFKLPNK